MQLLNALEQQLQFIYACIFTYNINNIIMLNLREIIFISYIHVHHHNIILCTL